jgi:hypothetical protein
MKSPAWASSHQHEDEVTSLRMKSPPEHEVTSLGIKSPAWASSHQLEHEVTSLSMKSPA